MQPGQEAIYTISGDDPASLAKSPQLEGFAAKGVEVLLMSDAVDDFWLSMVPDYQGKRFKSVTRGGADLDKIAGAGGSAAGENETKAARSEEQTSELQSLMRISYAGFCLKTKTTQLTR